MTKTLSEPRRPEQLSLAREWVSSNTNRGMQYRLIYSQRGIMNQTAEAQIVDAEDRLRTAMLSSDVNALDDLLAPDLIFTNHFGQLLGKQDDLAAYRSNMLKIEELNPSERHIRLNGDVAIVSVRMQVTGSYDGHPANGDFRFTRVWILSSRNTWYVAAAHAGIVA
jgi:ketosteroid isomerase-like protein